MDRFTSKDESGSYSVPPSAIEDRGDRIGGAAIERLGAFEDAVEVVEQQLARVTAQLDELKAKGRIRSAQGQQLLAQKLTYGSTLTLLGVRDKD